MGACRWLTELVFVWAETSALFSKVGSMAALILLLACVPLPRTGDICARERLASLLVNRVTLHWCERKQDEGHTCLSR